MWLCAIFHSSWCISWDEKSWRDYVALGSTLRNWELTPYRPMWNDCLSPTTFHTLTSADSRLIRRHFHSHFYPRDSLRLTTQHQVSQLCHGEDYWHFSPPRIGPNLPRLHNMATALCAWNFPVFKQTSSLAILLPVVCLKWNLATC
jgi:hypothetical protein